MKTRFRIRVAAVLSALLASAFLVGVPTAPAQAAETADWLPIKGDVSNQIGCTWDNGCDGNYHGSSSKALDIIMGVGVSVYAAGPGTVVDSNDTCHATESPGCSGSRGRFVEIAHPDGRHSRYLHLSNVVTTSGAVVRGQLIGYTGNSGNSSIVGHPNYSPDHLHYDELLNGSKVDPGPMKAVHGTKLVSYPAAWDSDYNSWDDVPSWSGYEVRNDSYTVPDPGPATTARADYNGTGKSDVFFYRPGTATDTMWFGSGDRPTGFATGFGVTVNGTYDPVEGDFDGDGYADVVWYSDSGDDAIWYGTSEKGTFTKLSLTIGSGFRPASGDIDGDGKSDLVLYSPGGDNDTVWYGVESHDSKFSTGYDLSMASGASDFDPLIGDFDGDGFDDVIFYGYGTAADGMRYGTATRGTLTTSSITIDEEGVPVVGDFNGSGNADVLWYGPGGANDALWYGRSDRSNKFNTSYSVTVSGTFDPLPGDYDGDGRSDILWYGSGAANDALWYAEPEKGEWVTSYDVTISGVGYVLV